MSRLGIIGAGAIGSAFARALARVGIGADISNSRGPASLQSLVQEIGQRSEPSKRQTPQGRTSLSSP